MFINTGNNTHHGIVVNNTVPICDLENNELNIKINRFLNKNLCIWNGIENI